MASLAAAAAAASSRCSAATAAGCHARRRQQPAERGRATGLSTCGALPSCAQVLPCGVCRLDAQLVRFSALATRVLRPPLRGLGSTVLSRAQLQGRATNGAGIQPWRTMRSSIVAAGWSQIIAARPRWSQGRFGAGRTGPFCDPIRLAKRADQAACDRAWLARTSLVRKPPWLRTWVVPNLAGLPNQAGWRQGGDCGKA